MAGISHGGQTMQQRVVPVSTTENSGFMPLQNTYDSKTV